MSSKNKVAVALLSVGMALSGSVAGISNVFASGSNAAISSAVANTINQATATTNTAGNTAGRSTGAGGMYVGADGELLGGTDTSVETTGDTTKVVVDDDAAKAEAEKKEKENEDLKARYEMIHFKAPVGGKVSTAFNSESSPYVTLEATPYDGYAFTGFTFEYRDGTPLTEEEVLTLAFTKDVYAVAHFTEVPGSMADKAKKFANYISLETTAGGTVRATFNTETGKADIIATPLDGYGFEKYEAKYEDGSTANMDDVTNLNISKKVTVRAVFKKTSAEETKDLAYNFRNLVVQEPAVGGSVELSFSSKGSPYIAVKATALDGYTYKGLKITDEDGKDVSFEDFIAMKFDKAVTVKGVFEKDRNVRDDLKTDEGTGDKQSTDTSDAQDRYAQDQAELLRRFQTLVTVKASVGGTLTLSFDSTSSPYVRATAVAQNGYVFNGIRITDANGNAVSYADFSALNFTTPVTVEGIFGKTASDAPASTTVITQNLKVNTTKGGTVTTYYDESTGQTAVKATPKKGYKFQYFRVTNADGTTQNSVTLEGLNIAQDATVTAVFKRDTISIKKAKVTGLKNFKYSGKNVTQKVTVKVNGQKATFKLKYSSRKAIGRQTLKITGTGKYTGTITKKFNILPADVKTETRVKKRTLRIGVKGLRGGAKGQIQWRRKGTAKWHTVNRSRYSKKLARGMYEVRSRAVKGKLKGSWTRARQVRV